MKTSFMPLLSIVALDEAEIKYSTVQNWYPGDENGVGGIYNLLQNAVHAAEIGQKYLGHKLKPARQSPGNIHHVFCKGKISR